MRHDTTRPIRGDGREQGSGKWSGREDKARLIIILVGICDLPANKKATSHKEYSLALKRPSIMQLEQGVPACLASFSVTWEKLGPQGWRASLGERDRSFGLLILLLRREVRWVEGLD